MKVCFIGGFTAGGTERITFLLASELSEFERYKISILNMQQTQPTFALDKRVNYDCVPKMGGGKLALLRKVFFLRKYIKRNKIDVIVLVEAMAGMLVLPAVFGLRCKIIAWEHANYFQTQNSRWTRKMRKLLLAGVADYYVVLTKRDLHNFQTHEKIKCPIEYIYNPIKLERDDCWKYDSSSKIIVSAGHLAPIKNFKIIPAIFEKIAEKYPDWQWHIYGGGTENAIKELETEIAKYGLDGKVVLKGRSANMDEVYSKAAIYVLTSLQEGLPTVLLEAQLHHLPCISFDIETGPDEIISDGINGLLVEPYDIEKMRAKILRLIEDKPLRLQMSDAAGCNFEKFDCKKNVKKWDEIITSVCEK